MKRLRFTRLGGAVVLRDLTDRATRFTLVVATTSRVQMAFDSFLVVNTLAVLISMIRSDIRLMGGRLD
jgi:hypothetical protein